MSKTVVGITARFAVIHGRGWQRHPSLPKHQKVFILSRLAKERAVWEIFLTTSEYVQLGFEKKDVEDGGRDYRSLRSR